jgi:phage protein U
MWTLMQWGPIQFEIYPLNFHEYDHHTGTAWARKDVMESIPQREWVGEDDEEIVFRGRIFPYHKIGGFNELEALDLTRRGGQAHLLMRGGIQNGTPLGWYVMERMNRQHSAIGPDGVGRVVNFDAILARVDVPPAPEYLSSMIALSA